MLSEEQNKKMNQLKDALDAGILTKEEYDKKIKEVIPMEAENKSMEQDGFYHYGETNSHLNEANPSIDDSQKTASDDGVFYFRENSGAQQEHTNPQPQQNRSYRNPDTSVPSKPPQKTKKNILGKFKEFWKRNKRDF